MKDNIIIKGFRFGMLLQLAVGPMCLMVYNTASSYGILASLILVLSIALVDALYITFAGFGIAAFINKHKVKQIIKIFGCAVLVVFGLNTITQAFEISILPSFSLLACFNSKNIFIQGILLTASNPLTIIFWGGVFSTQLAENNLRQKQIILFGAGCVFATLLFLSLVAVIGNLFGVFLPIIVIKILNIIVGVLLIYFGVNLLFEK